MKCKNCGEEIESKLLYCPHCGESIQLVPEYDVLEEELLSKVVEDKKKAKEDKFATGVYKPVDVQEPKEHSVEEKSANKTNPITELKKFWIKLGVFIGIVVVGSCVIFPFVGSHTYDNLLRKAILAEDSQKYAQALEYYKEAYELDHNSFEVIYGLARTHYNIKNYKEAIIFFKEAIKIEPNNPKLYSYLLNAYSAINDYESIYKLSQTTTSYEISQLINKYIVPLPEFSYPGGEYKEDIYLDLKASQDCEVFYTLNGKDPKISGKIFGKSIKLTEGTVEVKAVTQNSKGEYSQVVSQKYTITHGN